MSQSPIVLRCGARTLSLAQPRIMGILNVTPDSFSDGGRFDRFGPALHQAEAMVMAGADVIDVGGESTRPGANEVALEQELERVVPVVRAIGERLDCVVSVDTSKPEVMRQAIEAGAGLVNDVRALQEPGAVAQVVRTGVAVCLMHMQGSPGTMQQEPRYGDVVEEVRSWLMQRRLQCIDAGVEASQILLDPGFGFGKTFEHNRQLLRKLDRFVEQAPVLAGVSRKRMIGELLGDAHADRDAASAVASLLCVQHGASLVRVHDVASTAQALAVWRGLVG